METKNDYGGYTEIRCPSQKPHKIHNVNYPTCGQLLGGVNMDSDADVLVRCPSCKVMWSVVIENDELSLTKIPKGTKINFKHRWRQVNE